MWRVWEEVDESVSAAGRILKPLPFTKPSMDLTVMSYNILAQDLLEANQDLYTHCPLEVLDWNYRCNLLLEEIQKWAPDVSKKTADSKQKMPFFFFSSIINTNKNLFFAFFCLSVSRFCVFRRFRRTTTMNSFILFCLRWVGHQHAATSGLKI